MLILVFGPISGAHFNPAVTLAFLIRREVAAKDALLFVAVQIAAGIAGVLAAHVMFDAPAFSLSVNSRTGIGQWTESSSQHSDCLW